MFGIPRTNPIVSALVAALAIILIDQAAVPIALPTIQHEFNASFNGLDWIVNSYQLTLAAGIIIAGKLGDIWGYKKVLFIGLLVFSLTSLGIGFSRSINEIIIFRSFQGLGAACISPMITAMIIEIFPESHRGRALGFIFGLTSLFFISAPIVGGLLTHYLNWRYIFWINIPLTLYTFFMVQFSYQSKQTLRNIQIDWLGFLLGFICFSSFLFCLLEFGAGKTSYSSVFMSSSIFVIFLVLFILYEKKQTQPVIDFKLFKIPSFYLCMIALFLIFSVLASTIFWALFFQYVYAANTVKTSLMIAAGMLPIALVSPLAGWLRDRYGVRLPACIGAFNLTLALIWIAISVWWKNYWFAMPGFVLFGASASMIIGSFMQMAISVVPTAQRGEASGLATANRPFANAFGFAIFSVIIQKLNFYELNRQLITATPPLNQIPSDKIVNLLAETPTAQAAVGELPASALAKLYHFAIHAYTLGFSVATFLAALFAFMVFLLALKKNTFPNKAS